VRASETPGGSKEKLMAEENNNTDPSAPVDSPETAVNKVLSQISRAIFDRLAPLGAGTLTQEEPAQLAPLEKGFVWLRTMRQDLGRLLGASPSEADLAAAVALFPAGIHALITTRVDVRIRVSSSEGKPDVSILQCNEPEFLFNELSEPYDATHALHLVCDPAVDTGYTFVMIEFAAGKFVPKGWATGEEAARYSAEGAKSATGRPPDFRWTSGKSPL
jgi:hypothetical protein